MGTELMKVCVKEEKDDIPSVPPGFESLTSFALKRVQEGEKHEMDNVLSCSVSEDAVIIQPTKTEVDSESSDSQKIARSVRRRPWINHHGSDISAKDDLGCQKLDQNCVAELSLPKGVIRGCPDCKDCQKVIARWRQEDSCRPGLVDAPAFYPTEEEFEDTLKYIAKIRPMAEQYGICRIVPPPSWKPPCPLRESQVWETSKFSTRVQRVDKLQNRGSMKKISKHFNQMRKKRRKCMKPTENGNVLGCMDSASVTFGFEPGPEFSLKEFQKYADEFKAQYFRKDQNFIDENCEVTSSLEHWEPSIGDIEGEYWRIVERATEGIEVLYGADLETGIFGSGFPKFSSQGISSSTEKYIKSGWNLNNFPRLPGSVLSYESSDISGVLVPWLYIGMCFSSFCWHVEDHHLYSLNYMHWGAPKLWYGVPGKDALELEEAMRKHLPDLFDEQPDLLHKLVTQLSPSVLKSEGVPVYRCVQSAGEFVLTFPRAYHAGFNCGFNCAEAVNVAPVDWLPHGQIAIELYSQQGRKTSISHDKLLLGAAREAVKAHWELNLLKKNVSDNLRWKDFCGKDGILSKSLKSRVEIERARRQSLCNSSLALKMHSNFDATDERECSVCSFDLHLSAAGCRCSPEKYSCLNHVKQLCSCPWVTKYFLFRYDIDELNVLVEALEGKLSAVYRWARQDLGLALSAHVSGNKMTLDKLSPLQDEAASKESVPDSQKEILSGKTLGKSGITDPEKQNKSSESKLVVKDEKQHLETLVACSKPVNAEQVFQSSNLKSQAETSPGVDLSAKQCEPQKKASESGHDSIILLSDDEDDKPKKQESATKNENSVPLLTSADPISQVMVDASETDGVSELLLMTREMGKPSCGKPNSGDQKFIKAGPLAVSGYLESGDTGSPSSYRNNLERSIVRQKGPRIAKVVRRINCNVEPLEFGSVIPGKSWCNSRAIFPKGFRSRVKYINALDPINMCCYVSEILDAGKGSPLFMVNLERNPEEVFVHVSPTRCWEMVRERVNQEISKQHKAGKPNLPPLQPPGSLDGFEMFGFSSPAVVQAIEALDRNRVCTEYWDSRPFSRPQVQLTQKQSGFRNDSNALTNPDLSIGSNAVLSGLLKKANLEELRLLQNLLNETNSAAQLLKDELHNRLQ